ncbi:MAG: hypothetical protein HN348_19880 [Proteobacteria bacterium]|mgnify:CR=1 FL=1|jgi:hypothetical protein|nr:hypothetical protein [Pseudomonadota bacterium]
MSRFIIIIPIAISLSALTGCHDFTGQLVELGFISNLHLDSGHKWTPDHAIAAGSDVELKVSGIVNSKDDPDEFELTPSVKGRLHLVEIGENLLRITGKKGNRGVVQFRGKDKYDYFNVRFARPDGARLADPLDDFFEIDSEALAVVAGSEADLHVQLTDTRDNILGFVPNDLTVEGWGGIDASTDSSGEMHLIADDNSSTGEISIHHQGRPIEELTLPVIDKGEINEVELISRVIDNKEGEDLVAVLAVAWLEDDTRALGVDVDWSWTGGAEAEEEERSDLLVFSDDELPLEVEATIDGQTWTTTTEFMR